MGTSFYKLEHVPARYVQQPIAEHNDKYISLPYINGDESYNQCFIELSKKFKDEQVIEISTHYDMDKIKGLNKNSSNYKVQYFNSIDDIPYRLREYAPKEKGLIIMASDGLNIRFLGPLDTDNIPKEVLVFIELDWQSKGYDIDEFDVFMNKHDTLIIFPELLNEFKECFPESSPIQKWTLSKYEIIYLSM